MLACKRLKSKPDWSVTESIHFPSCYKLHFFLGLGLITGNIWLRWAWRKLGESCYYKRKKDYLACSSMPGRYRLRITSHISGKSKKKLFSDFILTVLLSLKTLSNTIGKAKLSQVTTVQLELSWNRPTNSCTSVALGNQATFIHAFWLTLTESGNDKIHASFFSRGNRIVLSFSPLFSTCDFENKTYQGLKQFRS